ncbi:hypothetical protein BHE74_00034909, partial [Ensete ventricosum]
GGNRPSTTEIDRRWPILVLPPDSDRIPVSCRTGMYWARNHVDPWVPRSDRADISCTVPKSKRALRHIYFILVRQLTKRLREPSKSKDKAKKANIATEDAKDYDTNPAI